MRSVPTETSQKRIRQHCCEGLEKGQECTAPNKLPGEEPAALHKNNKLPSRARAIKKNLPTHIHTFATAAFNSAPLPPLPPKATAAAHQAYPAPHNALRRKHPPTIQTVSHQPHSTS